MNDKWKKLLGKISKVRENEEKNLVYPEVIKPAKKHKYDYLLARALLKLKGQFSTRELSILFKKSKSFISNKLKDLR